MKDDDGLTEPNWDRAALLTIDMQNDFALPGGTGFVPGTDHILLAFACWRPMPCLELPNPASAGALESE